MGGGCEFDLELDRELNCEFERGWLRPLPCPGPREEERALGRGALKSVWSSM